MRSPYAVEFRGKTNLGQWVYGSLTTKNGVKCTLNAYIHSDEIHEVNPKTVGQFITTVSGKYDDKVPKTYRIYEDDIVKYGINMGDGYKFWTGYAKRWDSKYVFVPFEQPNDGTILTHDIEYCEEVILLGNIHDDDKFVYNENHEWYSYEGFKNGEKLLW